MTAPTGPWGSPATTGGGELRPGQAEEPGVEPGVAHGPPSGLEGQPLFFPAQQE